MKPPSPNAIEIHEAISAGFRPPAMPTVRMSATGPVQAKRKLTTALARWCPRRPRTISARPGNGRAIRSSTMNRNPFSYPPLFAFVGGTLAAPTEARQRASPPCAFTRLVALQEVAAFVPARLLGRAGLRRARQSSHHPPSTQSKRRGAMSGISPGSTPGPQSRRNGEEGAGGRVRGERRRRGRRIDVGYLGEHIGYVVRRAQLAIFKDFIKTLAPVDIRPAQYSVLIVIDRSPGLTQAELGRALAIKRANLVGMLNELER